MRCALIGMVIAAGADPTFAQEAKTLTKPASTVEVGVGAISDGSYKAGEYNGLQEKGAFAIGTVDIRGGGAFDSDSAWRYRIRGNDLGLDSRSLTAEAGVQGKFRFTLGYDSLRKNRSDSYQTPYAGAGTNTLTLPGTWLGPTVAGSTSTNNAVNNTSARGLSKAIGGAPYFDIQTTSPTVGTLLTPNATQKALVDAAANADVPLFRNFDISTTRTRYDAGVSVNAGSQWGVEASVRPEHKEGTKLMGTVSRNTGGDIATIIPDPIDTDTSQINVALNFKGARSFVQTGYYGSYFTNNIRQLSWQNWATSAGTMNTMSSAPDNSFTQFSAAGGHNFTSTLKLVANASYARNTQNDLFLTDVTTPVVPATSLNGLVVSSAVNLKLTARPVKKLNVAAAYKYDNRDNRTAVLLYQFGDAGEPLSVNSNFPAGPTNPLGAMVINNANANRSYSKKVNQFTLDADYAVAMGQRVKVGYEYQKINRECPGSWINCADAAITNESTLRAEWRATAGSGLVARIGYEYSQRRAPHYNEDAFLALVPYANVVPLGQAITALQAMTANQLTGYGPVSGYNNGVFVNGTFFPNNNALANALYGNANRISELVGMRRYYVADRNRNKLRTGLTWKATEALTIQAGVDYNNDDYPTSAYGLQHARTWAATVDGSYALTGNVTADLFYTYETLASDTAGNTYTANSNTASVNGFTGLAGNSCDSYTTLQQRNNNNKLDPCLNWSTHMTDKVNTVGFGLTGKSGTLDLAVYATVSQARSANNVSGGNWANNLLALPGAPASTVAAFYIPASPLPTVTTNMSEVRANARYAISKRHSVRALYTYMRMTSADWVYEGMQIGLGTPSGVLPTNEQPFNYSVNVVGVSWVISF
jgi:MtrB/PioB family decaheme-associated outer membrane protein